MSRAHKQTLRLNDPRVEEMMRKANAEGRITAKAMVTFYWDLCMQNQKQVFAHLKANLIRKDLRFYKDIKDEVVFQNNKMPRYVLSREKYFNRLKELLGEQDAGTRAKVWKLINMLYTN